MLSILSTLSLLTLAVPPPPFGSARHPVTREVQRPVSLHATPAPRGDFLGVAFGFYQTVVTPMDGPRCQHRPTCSLYARQAMARHGLVGLWLAYDRLLRDARSSAIRRLPTALEHGRLVYLDPLEESTFWFP
ncbi:membrane protein insertion efficiency factor YidD [Hyalangium versicolor]|uniref:membrane protein insertion efficiency factor YidD n=1 Tax=Hyalangium versicolor TaxID=2861190 RepID=UPI001CCCAB41|nr:membrane protein insertion efficiency factor YidD [Hyalangium versicolor]